MPFFRASLLALAAATFVAGCATDTFDQPGEDDSIDLDATEADLTAGPPIDCNKTEIAKKGEFHRVAYLKAVRSSAFQPGVDRFVLEFDGTPDFWNVRKTPTAKFGLDPTDESIQLKDRAGRPLTSGITMNVQYATAWNDETGKATVGDPNKGLPRRMNVANGQTMIQAAPTGDFEKVLSFGLGLNQPSDKICFNVFELKNPARLVIDVKRRP